MTVTCHIRHGVHDGIPLRPPSTHRVPPSPPSICLWKNFLRDSSMTVLPSPLATLPSQWYGRVRLFWILSFICLLLLRCFLPSLLLLLSRLPSSPAPRPLAANRGTHDGHMGLTFAVVSLCTFFPTEATNSHNSTLWRNDSAEAREILGKSFLYLFMVIACAPGWKMEGSVPPRPSRGPQWQRLRRNLNAGSCCWR